MKGNINLRNQMSVEIPRDLIQGLQLSFRAEAGLPSYDPDDPTLPAFPSLRQSVGVFDPDHRCRHCGGSLLRGPLSPTCVYCLAAQPIHPPPLAFPSTLGYQLLLRSLQLHGSEIVEPSIDEQAPNKGQSTPKNKIPLSDLLNLEIPWLAEPDITECSLSKVVSTRSKSMTNMRGIDLDNLFTYARDLVSDLEEEQAVTNKQNALAGQENIVFSPKFQNPIAAVTSSEANGTGDFSCWEADFQSADFDGQSEPSKSSDRLVSSTIDLSTHMDSVFGSGEQLENNEPKKVSTPSVSTTSDWTQGDPWNNSTHVADQVETTLEVKDCKNANRVTPSRSDWFPDDDQWQTNGNVTTENKPTSGRDENLFDVWNNFTSFPNAQEPLKKSVGDGQINITTGDDDSSDVWDFTSFSNAHAPSEISPTSTGIKLTTGNNESPDVWDNVTSSSNAQDPSKRSFGASQLNPTTGDDDSSDVWDDFTSFSNAHDLGKSSWISTEIKLTTGNNESPDVWDNVTSSPNAQDPSKRSFGASQLNPTTGDDDSSDVWDDFTSFSNAHDLAKSSWTSTEIKLTTGDNKSPDVWDNVTSSSNAQDPLKNSFAVTEIMVATGHDDSSDVWDGFISSSNAHEPFKISGTATESKLTASDDNSSDVCDAFASSSNAHDPLKSYITAIDNKPNFGVVDSSDDWDGFVSNSNADNPFKSSIVTTGSEPTTGVDDSSDSWDGFKSSSNAHDPFNNSIITTGSGPTTGVDDSDVWDDFTSYSDAHNPVNNSITATDNKPITGVDYSSHVWDFTSSSNSHDPFKGSLAFTNNTLTNTHDDSSDLWDDFTSSSDVQNPSSSSITHNVTDIAVVGEHTIDPTFPSSSNRFQEEVFRNQMSFWD